MDAAADPLVADPEHPANIADDLLRELHRGPGTGDDLGIGGFSLGPLRPGPLVERMEVGVPAVGLGPLPFTFGPLGIEIDDDMSVDVTDQVMARKQLETARGEAETATRAKDEFLAMLGHELRNPLSPIRTSLQLIRMRGTHLPELPILGSAGSR